MKDIFKPIFFTIAISLALISTSHTITVYDWTPTGTIEPHIAAGAAISVALNNTTTIATWFDRNPTFQPYPRYATWNGTDWSNSGTIEPYTASENAISVALDSTTTIVTWLENDEGLSYHYPRYAIWNDGTDWSNSGTIELFNASSDAISLASHNTTTIVTWLEKIDHSPTPSFHPRYATWNGTDWSNSGTIELCNASKDAISVALNNTTTIVTWIENTGSYGPYYPRYATWNGADWSNTGTIEPYNASEAAISVALDSTTTIVTWLEDVGGGIFYPRYATWSGSDWSNSGTIEYTNASKYAISVALDSTTTIVTWIENLGSNNYYPRYSIWNGTDWSNSGTIESSYSSYRAISIDSYNPTIASWFEKIGLGEFYPRYANLSSRSEDGDGNGNGTTSHSVSSGDGHYKIEIFGGIVFLIRIPYPHTTHTAYHNGQQLDNVHYHDNVHYVADPDASTAKTLTIKDNSGATIAYVNVPAYE